MTEEEKAWLRSNGIALPEDEPVEEEEPTSGITPEQAAFLEANDVAIPAPEKPKTQADRRAAAVENRRKRREAAGPDRLERATDSVVTGFSDAMSTLAGDNYTESGDKRDLPIVNLGLPFGRDEEGNFELQNPIRQNRLLKATAEAIRGAGGAAGEILQGVGDELGNPVAKVSAWMDENKASHPIYSQTDVLGEPGRQVDEHFGPDAAEAIKDATLVATSAAMFNPALRATGGRDAVRGLPDAKRQQRRSQIEERWRPTRAFDEPDVEVSYTGGIVDKRQVKAKPDSDREKMYDDLEAIEDLNPREAPGKSFNKIDAEAERLRRALDEDLTGKPRMSTEKLDARLENDFINAQNVPALATDSAKNAYNSTKAQWDRIVDQYVVDGTISPKDLLQARRDLDSWLRRESPKALSADVLSGQGLAVKHLRKSINDAVADHVPSVAVRESLRKQSSLLTARDEIRSLANSEAGNRFTRALQETQEATGLAMPHSPAAVGANLQPGALAVGTALLGANRLGHLGRRAGRNVGAAGRNAADTGWNVGRGAIPGISLPPEEEEVPFYLRRR